MKDWKKLKEAVDCIFKGTEATRSQMTKYLKHFTGQIWDKNELKDHDSEATFNVMFSTVENIAPMLTDSKPIVDVVPRDPFNQKLAASYSLALKYAWDATEMQHQLLKGVLSALIMKKGVFKVYYNPQKRYGSDLCIEVVDPRDFFISPGYNDEWEAPIVGIKTKRPISWIKSRFPDAKGVTVDNSMLNSRDEGKFYRFDTKNVTSMEVEFATIYEVWMQDDDAYKDVIKEDDEGQKVKTKEKKYPYGKYVYFTDSELLAVEPVQDMHGLPPYVTLDDYVHPFDFIGMGEGDQIFGLHLELNKQLQRITNYARKHHAPNYLVDTNVMDPDIFEERAHEGNQVFAKSGPDKAVEVVQEAPLNASITNLLMLIPQIIEEVSGVTEISKGQATKRERQSASEVAMMMESSHTRTRQKVRNLERTIKRIAYLLVRNMQQYWVEERNIHWEEKGGMNHLAFASSKEYALDIMSPGQEVMDAYADNQQAMIHPDQRQEYEDYKKFAAAVSEYGYADPILFDFDITIQTDSTLPMDKQSRANLALRLWETKLIDREAALEDIQHPNREKIIQRIEKKEQEARQQRQGIRPPEGNIALLRQAQGGQNE